MCPHRAHLSSKRKILPLGQPMEYPTVLIETDHFHAFLEHVTAEAPDLATACRWLACGPKLAPLILGEDVSEPSPTDLAQLAGLLETATPVAVAAGRALFVARSRFLAELDVALERLIAAGDAEWSHPTQILRPCPDYGQLLAACRARLESADGDHRRQLESVEEKLERAVRIEANARRRRAAAGLPFDAHRSKKA